jgi:uncharacterized protein (DUF1330 family)
LHARSHPALEGEMAGYVVAQNWGWTDQAAFNEYRANVDATIQQYGGRFLARGPADVREGDDRQPRLVIIEFPSVDRARTWYESSEYRPLRDLRQRCAETQLVIVEGL